jgi:hypothetical protein
MAGGASAAGMGKDREREDRLAAALRENLRKRKMRARQDPPLQGEGDQPEAGGGVSTPERNLEP